MIDSFESLEGPTRVGSPEGSVFEGKEKERGAFDKLGDEVDQLERCGGGGGDEEKGLGGAGAVTTETTPSEVVQDNFPEGGTRAYLALLGSTLVLLCTFGLSNSYGVFLQHYKQHQLKNYTNSDISWIGSL